MRGKTVAQRMRRNILVERGLADVFDENSAYAAVREPRGILVEKKSAAVFPVIIAALFHVFAYRLLRLSADGHHPFLLPLAADAQNSTQDVRVFHIQPHKFTHPDAKTVQRFKKRLVAFGR